MIELVTAVGFRILFLGSKNQTMNSSGIIPPREGVESLASARKALTGRDISSSHIKDAIISAHSAVASLFREYLKTSDFVPSEIRGRAGKFSEMSFPDLVGAMENHGRPPLGKRQTELLDWNGVRNRYAHGEPTPTTKSEAIAFLAMGEELFEHYSNYKPQTTSFMNVENNPMERPDPELVSFGKWPSTRLSDNIFGIKTTEKDFVVWFKENRIFEPKNKVKPRPWECDRYAIVHRGTVIWRIKFDKSQCGQKIKQYWSVDVELSLKMNIRESADISQIALTYNGELEHLKMLIKEELATILVDVQPDALEKKQNSIAKDLKEQISNRKSCFELGEVTMILGSPKYIDNVIREIDDEAARIKQWKEHEHAAAIKKAEWTEEFRRDNLTKLRNLKLAKQEMQLAKKMIDSIKGKEEAFCLYEASKSQEAFRDFIKSKFSSEQFQKANEHTFEILREFFKSTNPGASGASFVQFK